MSQSREEVVIDNDLVRVLRVRVGASERHEVQGRAPRVVISLGDEVERRRDHDGRTEEIRRRAGDVVFREASPGHSIENAGGESHEVIIVELKGRA
jgi:hypothetical protein